MKELHATQVRIKDDFWAPRLIMNAREALLHQWEQLERSGCIENFRLLAEGKEGFRQGWFFADSDAYKWLDAACRVYATRPLEALRQRIDVLVGLIAAAQTDCGYLYTYNQIHFPEVQWANLQIEHELYCHGHLIEAAVSHWEATGRRDLLAIAERAADGMLSRFEGQGPECTPGHEEVELALIRLYRVTGAERYLGLAQQFLEQRGRIRGFPLQLYRQNASSGRRKRWVDEQRRQVLARHPEYAVYRLPADNVAKKPLGSGLRRLLSQLSGKYFQQHRPLRQQTVPVGHAVRFAYLETAAAMLYQELGDDGLLRALEQAWERLVNRRMYVTGGIGALPGIEGFGRDYELDPEMAYAETCAALGCMFWDWEMTLITRQAKYADLFEWQLYNAASVGMGLDGRSYLYNNPLACRGGIRRQAWYEVPCCPSNLSRTWASLGRYLLSHEGSDVWLHQYVGSRIEVDLGVPTSIDITSGLPWSGGIGIRVWPAAPTLLTMHLRIPSWADGYRLAVNGRALEMPSPPAAAGVAEGTASGISPHRAHYVPIERTWSPGDVVDLELDMPVTVRRPHPKVRAARGTVALTRGPLVYCLESVDNPGLDLFRLRLDPETLEVEPRAAGFDGVWLLRGRTRDGKPVTAIPYAYWANRGPSAMTAALRV